jgi:hypothetical protein
MAARLEGEIELVGGALSADPEEAKRSDEDLLLEMRSCAARGGASLEPLLFNLLAASPLPNANLSDCRHLDIASKTCPVR